MWKGIKLVCLFDEQIVQVNILIDLPHKVKVKSCGTKTGKC